nr:Chain A, Ribonuclease pancreatic, S-peptide [Bos taurus]
KETAAAHFEQHHMDS